MKPTIYNPTTYKSPGIYKGTGGIYKGRGLYKDGADSVNIYKLNVDNFDISTLKDGDVQWFFYNNDYCELTKIGDVLKVVCQSSGEPRQFNCSLSQFNITSYFELEIELDVQTNDKCYFGLDTIAGSCTGNGLFDGVTGWIYGLSNYTIYSGNIIESGDWSRIGNTGVNSFTNIKFKLFVELPNKFTLFFNDIKIVEGYFNFAYQKAITFNNGIGRSEFYIKKVLLKYE